MATINLACVSGTDSKTLATKVVENLSEEQRNKWDITKEREEDAIHAIEDIIERRIGREPDADVRAQMLQDVDGFIEKIENEYAVVPVSDSEYEETKQQYDKFVTFLKETLNVGKITSFDFDDSEESQKSAEYLLTVISSYGAVASKPSITKNDGDKIQRISFMAMEPKRSEDKTAQQRALDTLDEIRDLSSIEITDGKGHIRYVPTQEDIPNGWRRTGQYKYNNSLIRAKSVSKLVHGDEDYTGPVVAGPIGDGVDAIGRLFFNKKSILYNSDGTIITSDEELQDIINNELGGIFTISGLKNLINDFQKLEKQLVDKWGNWGKLAFVTDQIRLFGKDPDTDQWIIGIPDLLVVDGRGVIHTLDFKTSKMSDIKGYMNIFHDDKENKYQTGKGYGEQISHYIMMEKSYGLTVDTTPYVILVDTWYDGSDTVSSRREGKEGIYNIPDKYDKNQQVTVKVSDDGTLTLGGYAEQNPFTREQLLQPTEEEQEEQLESDKTILYMEPRLHVEITGSEEEGFSFSDELAALRDDTDIPFKDGISYQEQWDMLSNEEKANLSSLGGTVVHYKTAQGIVVLSLNDIESRPDIISSREIQDVANYLMYLVSRTITRLQRGEEILDFPNSVHDSSKGQISPLKGLPRKDIIRRVGIDNLINNAFKIIESRYKEDFPTEEQYKNDDYDDWEFSFIDDADYARQSKMNEKAKWLVEHRQQLIMAGNAKLIALEDLKVSKRNETREFNPSMPSLQLESLDTNVTEDNGDNASIESYIESFLDGLTNTEAWMINVRNFSPKASLAQEIKRMFEDIDMTDESGNAIIDPYGWGFSMPINSTMAIQTILEACKNCETFEEMETVLINMATTTGNNWINQVLDKIRSDENLKVKFFRHFRKDALNYSICQVKFDKKTGQRVVLTRIVNMKSAYEAITQSLGSSFNAGSVGSFSIEGHNFSLISTDNGENKLTKIGKTFVADYIDDKIKELKRKSTAIQNDETLSLPVNGSRMTKQEKQKYLANQIKTRKFKLKGEEKEQTLIEGITSVLNGIGILVPEKVVENYCMLKVQGVRSNNATELLNLASEVIRLLKTQYTKDGKLPSSLTNLKAGNAYFPLLQKLSNSVQEVVEASTYQDGKTYYSYINPSRIGHIIRNLKDSIGSYNPVKRDGSSKFEKYLESNFGRYKGWFKDNERGEWLCDWLKQLEENSEAKDALQHKVELSYIGNHYRDLGSLGFQLSVLHNYFGSKDDNQISENYRWFALPTMSNKPTNEFIRMLKYKDNNEIIDKVLMNTFQQEKNRIADVLYHFVYHTVSVDQIDITDKKLKNAGWEQDEIKDLKDRIRTHSITSDDLIRLSRITSGAKFHFLWYLNEEIANNPELAKRLAASINMLLTTSNEQQRNDPYESDTINMFRETIASKMEQIVEQELDYMRSIGLFDKEIKKIKKNGEEIEVEVLKYQEEFGGKLGSDKHGEAEKEMENALREFIWQDIAANINIIQITGGDLAYYGSAVNYQKRIAQIHSPGLKIMSNDEYDDGYLRSVHISDEKIRDEIVANTEVALREYMDSHIKDPVKKQEYETMIKIIVSKLTDTSLTDGQSYSSPTSIKKKLIDQGEWDEKKEEAYQEIVKGNFNINHLGVLTQPRKPFTTSDMAKYSGSTTMAIRKVPLQDKNSEYLIILAEALARGSGQKSKLTAICDFMEATAKMHKKQGIDTVHFQSVGKVGVSGVIDISAFDEEFDRKLARNEVSEKDYNKLLTEYLLYHVRTWSKDGQSVQSKNDYDENERLVGEKVLNEKETVYNSKYVDTIPMDDYIIQQEVPAHLLGDGQIYGSQIRILGISDITPGAIDPSLIDEYKELHAQNIEDSYNELMDELGIVDVEKLREKMLKDGRLLTKEMYIEENELPYTTDEEKIAADKAYRNYMEINTFYSVADLPIGTPERNEFFKNLEYILQKELSKDAKYGLDMRRACSLQYDETGTNVIDFVVPLMDPIQSKRIQMLINSIIKKTINKQKITGGPVVQTTAYDKDLHIRFKDKKGNILPTFSEYGKSVEEYKRFLQENQAGIAYFECYMPIPNQQLERLMLKEDGSMMSFDELKSKLPQKTFDALTQVIGYRIPTEDKYSMVPLKIVGFVPKAAGEVVMMPQEITYLTGSDFDIDKMYIMLKDFMVYADKIDDGEAEAIAKKYKSETGALTYRGVEEMVKQVMVNAQEIINGNDLYSWTTSIQRDENYEKAQKFIDWYKVYLIKGTFYERKYDPNDLKGMSKTDVRNARNNRILDILWEVLTNSDTTSKMLNPGNFNPQKKTGRMINIIKSKVKKPGTEDYWTWEELSEMDIEQLDNLLGNVDTHNTTLPSSKIYFQRQNMQGTQMVGIFANNNVSHAFLTFQKIGIDLTKNLKDRTFKFNGITIGDPDEMIVLDPQVGFNGQLISKTIASFLAAAVDTAKDPTLADMNINTYTGGVAMLLARLGFDTEEIGLFLSQPVIVELCDLYFKNKTDGYYDGDTAIKDKAADIGLEIEDLKSTEGIQDEDTLSKDNFIAHLNDTDYKGNTDNYQKRILKAFWVLYQMANDLQELTFCTKFNSINNAVGPTIADTIEDLDRVERFFDELNKKMFYEPLSAEEEYTSPAMVIENDPILKAFFETTVDNNGASERIFKNFFPHYFEGFKNVKDHFQSEFMGGKKLSSKLYNQLLDEYLYYLLTYSDSSHKPTLPSSKEDKEKLVGNLVSRFKDIMKIDKRKPNLLLDQNLGETCLRVREKDEYIAVDTLVFNGSQLNADGQQNVRNAWTDLIQMNDPDLSKEENETIRKFGVDLFFYTLMRNGFGFSPKTLMHLASVIVRYNALYKPGFNNYINGLRGLKEVDSFLMLHDTIQWNRFCSQFVRNHANNRQLVPNIDSTSSMISFITSRDGEVTGIEFAEKKNGKNSKIYRVMNGSNPVRFVTVTTKTGTTLSQALYELDTIGDSTVFEQDDMIRIRYKKSNVLGLVNNFIEYDANSDIPVSFFEDIRKQSGDEFDNEDPAPEQSRDEDKKQNTSNEETMPNRETWSAATDIMIRLNGPQRGDTKEASTHRIKLRNAVRAAENESPLKIAFIDFLNAKVEQKQEKMDQLNKEFEKQNKCKNGRNV